MKTIDLDHFSLVNFFCKNENVPIRGRDMGLETEESDMSKNDFCTFENVKW